MTAHDLAARLRAAATALGDLADGPPDPGPWSGSAAEAYAATSARLRRRADDVAGALAGAADALDALAGGLPATAAALAGDLLHARLLLDVATSDDPLATTTRHALDRVATATDPVTGRSVEAHLMAWDPAAYAGDGRAVLAVGDPATADDVALLVPGLGTDAGDLGRHTGRALDLHGAARALDPDDEAAVVAWIGYDAPRGVEVLTDTLARDGGDVLARDVADLRDARADDPAHLTVVGHSYGSVAASLAATGPGLPADDLVLAGSPGAGDARHADDLGPGRVWVLRHSLDPVAALGRAGPLGLGEDPALDAFGATRLRAESGPRDSWEGWPAAEHASYFVPGGEAMDNLAHVVTGRRDGMTPAPPLHDPWWAPPLDPELGRTPADPTDGRVR